MLHLEATLTSHSCQLYTPVDTRFDHWFVSAAGNRMAFHSSPLWHYIVEITMVGTSIATLYPPLPVQAKYCSSSKTDPRGAFSPKSNTLQTPLDQKKSYVFLSCEITPHAARKNHVTLLLSLKIFHHESMEPISLSCGSGFYLASKSSLGWRKLFTFFFVRA